MHPLWFAVLPAVAIAAVLESFSYVKTGRWGALLGRRWAQRVGVALVLALVCVWAARWFGVFGGPVAV
jgi:hypothetical protein